jgi:ATP-binding cassette subfamily C (CFTR/MRP) protein 4
MPEIDYLINQPVGAEIENSSLPSMYFSSSIQFKDLKFRYSPHGPWVLDGINFTICKGEKIAFVGSTGS